MAGPMLRAGRTALMAPIWLTQLATGAKSFMDNPLLGSPALNARGLHVGRSRAAHGMAAWRRRRLAHMVDAEDRATFDRDGYLVKTGFLPAPLFERLIEEVKGLRTEAREAVQGNAVTRRIALDPATLGRAPRLREALRDERWRGLLRYAFSYDAEPICYLQSILTHAYTGPDDPQCELHADTFHPTVKAWLFLTDVPEDESPFTYVPGSQRLTPARLAWEYKRSVAIQQDPDRLSRRGSLRVRGEELAEMGLPPARALAVPANTLVVADTCGFHARGPSVRATRRVELWAYGRRNPFLPWTGLDPWQIEGLGGRRIPAFWWASDMVERMGGRPNLWKARQGVSAFDEDVRTEW